MESKQQRQSWPFEANGVPIPDRCNFGGFPAISLVDDNERVRRVPSLRAPLALCGGTGKQLLLADRRVNEAASSRYSRR